MSVDCSQTEDATGCRKRMIEVLERKRSIAALMYLHHNGCSKEIDLREDVFPNPQQTSIQLQNLLDCGFVSCSRREVEGTRRTAKYWSLTSKGLALTALLELMDLTAEGVLDPESVVAECERMASSVRVRSVRWIGRETFPGPGRAPTNPSRHLTRGSGCRGPRRICRSGSDELLIVSHLLKNEKPGWGSPDPEESLSHPVRSSGRTHHARHLCTGPSAHLSGGRPNDTRLYGGCPVAIGNLEGKVFSRRGASPVPGGGARSARSPRTAGSSRVHW